MLRAKFAVLYVNMAQDLAALDYYFLRVNKVKLNLMTVELIIELIVEQFNAVYELSAVQFTELREQAAVYVFADILVTNEQLVRLF